MRLVLLCAALAAAGCNLPRLPPPPPRPPEGAQLVAPPPNGSIWHPELAGNYAFLDVRAHFPGDLLTVVVSESAQGKKDATTTSSADSSMSASVDDFFGIPAAAVNLLPSGFKPSSIVTAATQHKSTGVGTTSRDGTLTASITVTVVAVDPSGNLRVRGDKVVSVNREEQYIVLTGVVRPEDIAADNSVVSSRIGEARIDYYGRGTVADTQGTPLVHRLFDWVWPF